MIYFNNATTSFPKPKEVIDKVNFLFQNPFTDTGRSIYTQITQVCPGLTEIT